MLTYQCGNTQTMDTCEEEEHLHGNCECQSQNPETSHGPEGPRIIPKKQPKDDLELSDFESDSDLDDNVSHRYEINIQGKVIVPTFAPHLFEQSELVKMGQSLGSISLPPQRYPYSPKHPDLVWAGSSMETMHYGNVKQPVPIYSLGGSNMPGSRMNGLQKTPSIRTKMSSCMLGSQTVSESGTDMYAFCRICQMQGDDRDPLISPCRCAGTLRHIHPSCLKKWIRISQRRGKKQPPRCELCHFQYNRHKRFKFSQWRWPRVRPRDKCLHIIFLLNLIIMIGCAIATVMCFLSDRGNVVKFPKDKVKLTTEEVITLTCGVMFFVAFFIAMTVEIKARHTLYKLFLRFVMHNTEWTVEQYDITKDPLYNRRGPVSVV